MDYQHELEAVDPRELDKRFRDLAKQLHPDHNGDAAEFRALLSARKKARIKPAVCSGVRIQYRGQRWKVLRVNSSGSLWLERKGPAGILRMKAPIPDNPDTRIQFGSRRYVPLKPSDWQRIKKALSL